MRATKNKDRKNLHGKMGSRRRVSPRSCLKANLFENEPKVIVTPLEITALNSLYKKMNSQALSPHLKRLEQVCKVRLRRDNLSQLRDDLMGIATKHDCQTISIICKICEKPYTSVRKLKNHHENKHTKISSQPQKKVRFSDHVIVHEVTDYHSCRKCTKLFETYALLKNHLKSHKKRKQYICDYCSKEFMDRMIFKVHIKMHCDACGLLLPTRAKYLEHRHNICKVTKRYKCKMCSNTYFKYMDLKDHNHEHIGTFYVCDICKKQFQSYCQLSHHICYTHTDKQPVSLYNTTNIGKEKLYCCNFCNKSYAYKTLIEKHIEALPNLINHKITGYEDHLFCDVCLIQFNNEKDLLQHKPIHSEKKIEENKTVFKLDEIPHHYLIPKVVIKKDIDLIKNFISKTASTIEENDLISKEVEFKLNFVPQETKLSSEGEDYNLNSILQENNLNSKKDNLNCGTQENSLNSCTSENLNSEKEQTDLNSEREQSNLNPEREQSNLSAEKEDNNLDSVAKIKKKINRNITFSKHQCENCCKYFSSGYTLRRHIQSLHRNYEDLQCKVCEEVFVWPSLLATHKCIRLHHPEMPFQDARPEIQIDNLFEIQNAENEPNDLLTQDAFDSLNISANSDYVDFDIPAPIVNMTEDDSVYVPPVYIPPVYSQRPCTNKVTNNLVFPSNQNVSYKLVLQEVPIEF